MTLTFYSVTDDPRTLTKTLGTATHTVTGAVIYQECSILAPSFMLDYDSDIIASNYIVADSSLNNRHYFIKDVSLIPGGKCVVHCAIDVLMTYNTAIKDLKCNIVRNENIVNKWLPDSMMQKTAKTYTCNKYFSEDPFAGLSDKDPADNYRYHYVLSVVGGNGS